MRQCNCAATEFSLVNEAFWVIIGYGTQFKPFLDPSMNCEHWCLVQLVFHRPKYVMSMQCDEAGLPATNRICFLLELRGIFRSVKSGSSA